TAEQDGHDHQVHVVDQAGAEVLLDLGDATAEPDVVSTSSPERPLERRLDALVDKVERRPALHRDGRTWVVGEHEHRVVIRRVVPPPATPLVAAPWPADRAENCARHDRGADPDFTLSVELGVQTLVARLQAPLPATTCV